MARLIKINVVFVYVADLERSRKFYEEIVGFGKPIMKNGTWVEYRLEEGAHFGLHKTESEHMELCEPSLNTVKFSIVVDDLQGAYEEMSAKGVIFIRPPEKGYGFLIGEFADPDGNQIRLLQYTTMRPPA